MPTNQYAHAALWTASVGKVPLYYYLVFSSVMAADKKPFERLPTDVVPSNYKLELRPDLKEFKFTGKIDITVDVSLQTILYMMYMMHIIIK